MSQFIAAFRTHPASVGETYFTHFLFAMWFASRLIGAGLAALIHALIPPLFETTASDIVASLYERTQARKAGN